RGRPGHRAGARLDHRCHRSRELTTPDSQGAGRAASVSPGRLSLLLTSPRLAPGLLSRDAWDSLVTADVVLARSVSDAQPRAIRTAGVPVTEAAEQPVPALARELLDRAADGRVVWVGSP